MTKLAAEKTDFPNKGDDEKVSLRNSEYPQFDHGFASDIKENHASVWALGGNIRGNEAFEYWTKARGGDETEGVLDWIREREAWAARHEGDFRIAGVVAQMKWGVIGSRGESYMKDLVRDEIAKREDSIVKKHLFDIEALRRPMNRASAPPQDKSWYAFRAEEDLDEAEILIYNEIGYWGITAGDFVSDLAKIKAKKLNVRINSPGGSVFDGLAIYDALARHSAKVCIHIDGWAASIASVIAMAGDEICIAETARLMIHKPWSFVMGDAIAMRSEADILDSLEDSITTTYEARTEIDRAQLTEWIGAETWFTGQEAVDAGFCDTMIPAKKKPAKPAARMDAGFFAAVFKRAPADFLDTVCPFVVGATASPFAPRAANINSKQGVREALMAAGMKRGPADALANHFRPASDARDEPPQGDNQPPNHRDDVGDRAELVALLKRAAATLTI